jgi:hypothetical protein
MTATFSFATLFLPEWALPWIVVLAVAAWILGARALAGVAIAVVIADVVIAPLLAPWIEALPTWAFVLILVVFALTVINGLLVLLFGREAAGQVTGTYLVRLIDFIFLGPFRLLRFLVRAILRRP